MKAKIVLVLSLLVALIFCPACDKEGSESSSLIVGTWYNSKYNGGITQTFYKNGKWEYSDEFYPMSGSYSYDAKSGVLVIDVVPSSYNGGGMRTYFVLSLTSTTLTYTDGGGVINNFSRVN